jgi:hypothetical protein
MCATAVLFSCLRKKFTDRIDQILENTDASNALSSMDLAMVDSALCQENFYLARKYLREAREKVLYYYCNTKSFSHRCNGYVVHIDCLMLKSCNASLTLVYIQGDYKRNDGL